MHVTEDGLDEGVGPLGCFFVVVGSCPSIYVVYKDGYVWCEGEGIELDSSLPV